MKVALVYDRVNKWGGAERVLLALHKMFPDAPLYTSVYNPKTAGWASIFNIKTSFLQKFPIAKKRHDIYAPLMPVAFESFNFSDYDLVISVTSEAGKGVITNGKTKHICYCLTPTRYLWSGYHEYFKTPIKKIVSKPLIGYLKKWDKTASKRPDHIVGISTDVGERIKKYYGRDAKIIYPPVEISNIQHPISNSNNNGHQSINSYFLVVSRLVPYKKVNIAIRACNELNLPLKIIGKGSDEKKLKKIAGDKTEFLGEVTDLELIDYYKNCNALIFPGKEDFGLVMAEAQVFGKPVIAFKGGGALDIVIDKKTGELFKEQSVEGLKRVLEKFISSRYNSKLCRENAKKFSFEIFQKQFAEILNLL